MRSINLNLQVKILAGVVFFLCVYSASGQSGCFSPEEAKKTIKLINTPQISNSQNPREDKNLKRELLDMQEARRKIEQKIIDSWGEDQKLIALSNETGKKHLLRLCEIIRQNGWVGKEKVGDTGGAAISFLIIYSKGIELQKEILPVVSAAVKKGLLGRIVLACLIDSIRIELGQPQVFGTQTQIRDEVFYLYPLQNEKKVDEWRKLYNLPPLADFIKFLQSAYVMPVIQSPRVPVSPQVKAQTSSPLKTMPDVPLTEEKEEVVRIESNLVNLNIQISSDDLISNSGFNLQKDDFVVSEDGKEQQISFFSATEAPFDLILLLDLSGSTVDKQGLIRKAARHFIEASRPTDRIAIVTFTNDPKIVSPLTQNREELLKQVKKIGDAGGSGIWKAVEYSIEKIVKPESGDRRSAIVLMTDGMDAALLPNNTVDDSFPTFTHLLETVRNSSTTIIPVFLETQINQNTPLETNELFARASRQAWRTLNIIADESGGRVYKAGRFADLDGIYEKVISDLSKVYSLGYEPSGYIGDGTWRSISVKIKNHPDLYPVTKKGYYAK